MLVTVVIIPPGTCKYIVLIFPTPAELLPAILIIYMHMPNWFRR